MKTNDKTTKQAPVSRYANRINSGKGGKLNDKTVVAVNHTVADKVIEEMPTQVQLLIMNIDEITEQLDKCSMISLNNKWEAYGYKQYLLLNQMVLMISLLTLLV